MEWIVWALSVVLLGLAGFLAYASFSIRAGVYAKALCKGDTDRRVVCLTFDDGPHEVYTPQVLDVLKRHQAPATFFCIGGKAQQQKPLLLRMEREGHLLGNHSRSHSWKFPFFSYKKMYNDIQEAGKCLTETGREVLLFRPPFGVTNPTVAKVVREMHLTLVGWSIRSFDTQEEGEDKIFRRIVRQLSPGAVILLHDRMPGSAPLLARLLDYFEEVGYKVIPLNEMFNIPDTHHDELSK